MDVYDHCAWLQIFTQRFTVVKKKIDEESFSENENLGIGKTLDHWPFDLSECNVHCAMKHFQNLYYNFGTGEAMNGEKNSKVNIRHIYEFAMGKCGACRVTHS